LVLASDQAVQGARAYYLVTPERADERPVMKTFLAWLQQAATNPPAVPSSGGCAGFQASSGP
jgi:LysR family glycine cleavage system transcriptional activator